MSEPMSPTERAWLSLEGLSTGDAFGERFFGDLVQSIERIKSRTLDIPSPWRWTDDTAMAKSVAANLEEHGDIEPGSLAEAMMTSYQDEPWRGYGAGAHDLFKQMAAGTPWHEAAGSLFNGTGSYGNGAAMRVAPVGAYFSDDLDAVVPAAGRSAIVTHAHIEGQAGAIAIAVAAAIAWQMREDSPEAFATRMFEEVLARTPPGLTRDGIQKASQTDRSARIEDAVTALGNGTNISSQDTVPLCLWCIARHPRNYEEALWTTVSGLGDRDTTCAIVGGVVALSAPMSTIPKAWMQAREPLAGILLDDNVPR